MFLSSGGGSSVATPINSAVGIGENKLLQAQLASNLNSATLVAGNANTVLDTLGSGNWNFYVAPSTSIDAITSASDSSEWTGGSLLNGIEPSPGTLVRATFAADANSRIPGKSYLQLANPTGTTSPNWQFAKFTPFAIPATGFSFAFWFWNDTTNISRNDYIIYVANSTQNNQIALYITAAANNTNMYFNYQNNNPTYGNEVATFSYSLPINTWVHVVLTVDPANLVNLYINGGTAGGGTKETKTTQTPSRTYPIIRGIQTLGFYDIGTYSSSGGSDYSLKGTSRIDNFKVFTTLLSDAEVLAEKNRTIGISLLTQSTAITTPAWAPAPGIPVDPSETSYTVKSTEVALTPGANSTYAVWTSPKSTNIRVDVSFADYHSRSAGVGFQMFKINRDNTFGSVIFPRTVTSVALTDANPTNYLTVPSKSISVVAGDKVVYRIDGNGNPTSASSVLATNIYVDPNQDLKQNTILQAHLGNNLTATSFVSGNANVVNDTLGTGNWKFYVAGNTSIAAVTGASASSEWTMGNLLSYSPLMVAPVNYSKYYRFETADKSGSTVADLATGSPVYNATLMGSAAIVVNSGSRVSGQGYLSLTRAVGNYLDLNTDTINITTAGFTIAMWFRATNDNTLGSAWMFDMRNGGPGIFAITCGLNALNPGVRLYVPEAGGDLMLSNDDIRGDVWRHLVITIEYFAGTNSVYKCYLDGVLQSTNLRTYPSTGTRDANCLGGVVGGGGTGFDGGFDDFRYYNRAITADEVGAIYAGSIPAKISDTVTGATWMPIPGTPVVSSETLYTVKSNEIALKPGSNSTYAVWTATKSTNLKIDVSFADYNSRSANGVGFQMFKIKSDNTFDSVLFPRTVTSTALTNSAPSNYLTVPTINTTVTVGDKIYYRVDGNGISTSASSVLATTIFTDAVSAAVNPVETKLLQAQLGNNVNAGTYASGNANTIVDTLGNGNWNFYVAPTTSIAPITAASDPSEWNGGSLLSYTDADYYMFYPFNTNTVSGTTLLNKSNNSYDATLVGGASIANDFPSPASQPAAPGTGYLSMNVGAGQYVEINQPVSLSSSGITLAFWFRFRESTGNGDGAKECPIVSFDDGTNYFIVYMWGFTWVNVAWKTPSSTTAGNFFSTNSISNGTWVHIAFKSSTGSLYLNGIYNTTLSYGTPVTMFQPTKFYFGNSSASASFLIDNRDFATKSGTVRIDNFILYNKTLTDVEIGALYAQPSIYYTFDSDSISGGINVGSKATGIYVYNATLVNSPTIGTSNPSPAPTSGTGHLLLTSTNTIATNQYVQLTNVPFPTNNWFSIAFWARSNSTLGSSAKITFFDFANSIAASENANYSFSMYLQSNAVRAKISYGTSGTATDDILLYTDPNILTDNVWRHYAWTIDYLTTWRLYINSVLVFTKSSGFNRGMPLTYVSPSTINYTNCFIGRDAGSWQTASFSGAIDEFRFYSGRTIGQSEVSNLYATQVSVGKFQNPSGSSPTWISKPAIPVDATETSYTVKSTEIALIPGTNSTYAVWTAPKSTNLKIDVSFADYHSRSTSGVGFQMFKINRDNTFGSVIFPRTTTGNAITDATLLNGTSSYLTVPTKSISVATGDKIYYRIDGNGNPTSASSVLATNIYVDPNQDLKQNTILQAHLGNNLTATSFVAGNANVVLDTLRTGNWKFYVAGNTSIAPVTGASGSSGEWTVGNLLSYTPPQLPASDYALYYTFDVNTVLQTTGNTILDSVSGTLNASLASGAKTSTGVPTKYGIGSLDLSTQSGSGVAAQHLKLPTFTISQSTGFSVSFWAYFTEISNRYVFDFSEGTGTANNNAEKHLILAYEATTNRYSYFPNYPEKSGVYRVSANDKVIINQWQHICLTISTTAITRVYLNSAVIIGPHDESSQNIFGTKTAAALGTLQFGGPGTKGYIDDFKIYHRALTADDVNGIYLNTIIPAKISDTVTTTGAAWIPTPGTVVDSTETLYTVKSNEVALTPGSNSTYAVWTATKSTNLKIDVSFADYNSRSANGVGFQMFKIKSDNTFDSVLFPRTVTSTALTNVNSTNYLTVPTINTTVNAGDKIYYRVDGNGISTSASSVLATAIYTDAVSTAVNPVETKLVQAQLATNLSNATLVAGNANTILDTAGAGDWKFYVAPSTSIAAITSASASSEWTGGSILPYVLPPSVPTDMSLCFTFNSDKVSGTTIYDSVGNFTATLINSATIAGNGSPGPGQGYLSLTKASGQYVRFVQPFSILQNGITVTTWFRATSNNTNATGRIYDFRPVGGDSEFSMNVANGGIQVNAGPLIYSTNVLDNVWRHLALTVDAGVGGANSTYKTYINGVLQTTVTTSYPTAVSRTVCNIGTSFNIGTANYAGAFDGGIDDFRIYQRPLTAEEVSLIYSQPSMYFPLNVADINPSVTTQVGEYSTGSYVYNGILTRATIAVDGNSRVSGQGYLSVNGLSGTSGSAQYLTLPTIRLTQSTGFSISLWVYPYLNNDGFIFDFRNASGVDNFMLACYNDSSSKKFVFYPYGTDFIFTENNSMTYDKWNHVCITISPTNFTTIYVDSVSRYSNTPTANAFSGDNAKTLAKLGSTYLGNNGLGGGIDDFRVHQRVLSQAEVSALYAGTQPPTLKDTVTGATWLTKPATLVDATENLYTVKSNEIALKPGTNSTYAVWTSPKSTNIRLDVSFADYHSRSTSGVGFQIFKINADNTFGSVIFPRTTTVSALTDANSSNYLTVPSTSLSVNTGDKLVYRIDGNGNPTSSSSVLATNIYSYSGRWY